MEEGFVPDFDSDWAGVVWVGVADWAGAEAGVVDWGWVAVTLR